MTDVAHRRTLLLGLADSANLRRRRYDLLPLRGDGSPFTGAQARPPGEATTPDSLADLISSISEIGLLQPPLIEELPDPDGGPPRLRVVVGERRLSAMRWGAAHLPDNPHFTTLPAIICPGPLSEAERQIWQLVENFAHLPLQPGELAMALLLYRCTVLTGRLLAADKIIPAEIYDLTDPAERFRALEKIRGHDTDLAAPWSEVLQLLGLQVSARKARELVRAFGALPRELVEDMDEHKIRLNTRIQFIALRRGRAAAADDIWAAVKARRAVDLLPAALAATVADPHLDPTEAVELAEHTRQQANLARSEQCRTTQLARLNPPRAAAGDPDCETGSGSTGDQVAETEDQVDGVGDVAAAAAGPRRVELDDDNPTPAIGLIDRTIPAQIVRSLNDLTSRLQAGARLHRFDTGSLILAIDDLVTAGDLGRNRPRRGDGRSHDRGQVRGRDLTDRHTELAATS